MRDSNRFSSNDQLLQSPLESAPSNRRNSPLSITGIILLLVFIPLSNQLPGLYFETTNPYHADLPEWANILLLYPSTDLVDNPVVRMAATICALGILVFLFLDVAAQHNPRRFLISRELILWILMLIIVVIPTFWTMLLRTTVSRQLFSHDGGILQTEEAMSMLRNGHNPYTDDYTSPLMRAYAEQSSIKEPLYHNPYLPASFLLPYPFYILAEDYFGIYDQHFFYILCFLLMMLTVRYFAKNEKRLLLMALIGLNPSTAYFVNWGRNDIVIFLCLISTIFFLERKWPIAAGIMFGIGCSYKQLLWFTSPFVAVYIIRYYPNIFSREPLKLIIAALIVLLAFNLPFIVWDGSSYYDDIFAFNAGTSENPYPLGGTPGFGISNILLYWGLVSSRHAYFPFTILMALAGIPLIIWLLKYQLRNNSRQRLFTSIVLTLYVIPFLSRFFHDNYIVLISMIAPLIICSISDDEQTASGESDSSSPGNVT